MFDQATIDFAQARADRDAGMASALQHAESDCIDWPDKAYAFLADFARYQSHFCGYEVTAASHACPTFPQPVNERAWGGIYTRAQREGLMVKDGCGVHPKRHASICTRYRSMVFVGGAA